MSMQMVRIVNKGDKTFRDMFANQTYEVEPGKSTFVPFDAAALWFGHPDVFDVSPRQRPRTDLFKRLRLRYGAYDQTEEVNGKDVPVGADVVWERNKPQVEVYTLEGKRLNTVVDDPEGRNVTIDDEDASTRDMSLRMQALENELRLLREAQKSQRAVEQNEQDADDGNEDGGEDGGEEEPEQPVGSDGIPEPTILSPDPDSGAEPDSPRRSGVQYP